MADVPPTPGTPRDVVFKLARQDDRCLPGIFVATHVIDALSDTVAARLTLLSDDLVVVTAAVPPGLAVGDLRRRVVRELDGPDGRGWALQHHVR